MAFTVGKFGASSLLALGNLVLMFYVLCALFVVLVLWPIAWAFGINLAQLIRYIAAELMIVVGTSSSESVFPRLHAKLRQLGVDPPIVVLASTLAATGTIPVASVALILGVHRLLSSAFVPVNVLGNAIATLAIGKMERAIDMETFESELKSGIRFQGWSRCKPDRQTASERRYMVIDCHGHYTTVAKEIQGFRDAQIAGLARGESPALPQVSDDQIRESVQPQLAFQAARGTDLTIFSPRASSMGHHVGDAPANQQWARLCSDLIHRVCSLFPKQFVGVCQLPQTVGGSPAHCLG